ncbi:hypothetical protein O3P69_002062 [Scylla paramamosain]|uniref:Uncharacterized protein n=1 Tax=Scylla paramamosain TaxID=85552 RepID=A0AAW0V4M6_SCYPA
MGADGVTAGLRVLDLRRTPCRVTLPGRCRLLSGDTPFSGSFSGKSPQSPEYLIPVKAARKSHHGAPTGVMSRDLSASAFCLSRYYWCLLYARRSLALDSAVNVSIAHLRQQEHSANTTRKGYWKPA